MVPRNMIASILSTRYVCVTPSYCVCNVRIPRAVFRDLYAKYVYSPAIDNSSTPHFHKVDGFTVPSLHTTTAHFNTFAVTLHFLVYSIITGNHSQ